MLCPGIPEQWIKPDMVCCIRVFVLLLICNVCVSVLQLGAIFGVSYYLIKQIAHGKFCVFAQVIKSIQDKAN